MSLLAIGTIAAWRLPAYAIAPLCYLLAVLTTCVLPGRALSLVSAALASLLGAVTIYLSQQTPSVADAAWFAGLWCAALLIHWRARRPHLDPRELARALQNARAGLLITDLNGRVITLNQKMAAIFQRDQADMQGMALVELVGAELWRSLQNEQSTVANGEALDVDFEVRRDDGDIRTLACHCKVALAPSGAPIYYVLQVSDVTNARVAQRVQQASTHMLQRLLGKASDFALLTDSKLNVTFANDSARSALSQAGQSLGGEPAYRLIHPDDRRAFMKTMEQFALKNRNEASLDEVRLANSEGTPVAAHISRLSQSSQPGYAIIFNLLEPQTRALADSRASQARFSQVFHGSPDAILLLRASDTVILDFNAGFTRLLGYRREDAIGELELHLGFWASPTERDAMIERLRIEREVFDYETTFKRHDGTLVPVEISLRYVEIDNQLCLLGVGRDITRRISAEAALVESEEKFEKMFSHSPDGIVILRHADGIITDLNRAMLSRSGYERDEIIGQSIYEFPDFIDRDDLQTATGDMEDEGRLTNRAVTFRTKSGEVVPTLISATIVELSGEAHVMVIAKDISKQRTTEERLRRSEERFRGIFENAPIGIMLVDMQGRIFQANPTAADLLAYDEQQMYGIHVSRLVPAEDRQSLKEGLAGLTVKQARTHRSERRMICQNGLEIWTNFHVVLQLSEADEALYYIVQIADISDIKRGQERMERMAFYDTLTNLANRRLFHERLEHAIEHCVRTNCASALLYLDLDNFKRVNDTLGHEVGDHLLREVAQRLKQCVRAEDTVGRTGGDEFTILLAEIASPTDAGVVAQKILNHLREPIHISGHPLIVTTSIGITVVPGDALDPNVLMRNADLAMYKAKERGRNNYQFYSEDLNTNTIKRLRTEYEIRQALERREFELYFQPKIALATNKIVGVESLIRWNHPERGVLAPEEFIEVAEDTGCIIDIGSWAIEEACRACQFLTLQQGKPVDVAVNLSPRQFRDPNLVATVRRSLREADLDPRHIEIEITETMLMQDVDAAQVTIQRLSELGVRLAIDDFGTGYSSLNYLKRFPINTVKVDRSFVMGLPSNADDMAITRAVIAMAHQLKMEVVAEGVETRQQLEFLAEHECEYAQGWLFSKALPLTEVAELLARQSDAPRVVLR